MFGHVEEVWRAGRSSPEQRLAFDYLGGLVNDPSIPVFVWSYEAFLMLGDAYSKQLLDALKLPRPLASEPTPELPLPTYDGNRAYARRRRPWELLRAAALSLVAPRAPACADQADGGRPRLGLRARDGRGARARAAQAHRRQGRHQATAAARADRRARVGARRKARRARRGGRGGAAAAAPAARARAAPAPPLLVKVHGGPTACTSAGFNPGIQFWTSRGFAVLDVDYGGSTGYGREYRRRLRGQWGVVDIDDACAGAEYLVKQGLADGARLAIDGGSAGGYTTLGALAFRDVFTAGCSLYGVADLGEASPYLPSPLLTSPRLPLSPLAFSLSLALPGLT